MNPFEFKDDADPRPRPLIQSRSGQFDAEVDADSAAEA